MMRRQSKPWLRPSWKASWRRGEFSHRIMPSMWLSRNMLKRSESLGEISLREAVEFFLRHNRADVPRLTLAEIAEQFAKSQ